MKKVEIALIALTIIAVALRVSSVQGGEALSAVAFLLLALFYLLLSIPYFNGVSLRHTFQSAYYREREADAFRRFWAGAAGVIFFIVLMGILFVLNYWKAAFFFWCMGMFFTVPVAALSLGKHMLQPSPFYKAIAIRAGILLLAGIGIVAAEM